MKLKQIIFLMLFGLGVCHMTIAQTDQAENDFLRNKYNTRIQLGYSLATANGGGFTFRYTKEKHGIYASLSPFISFGNGIQNEIFGESQIGLNYNYYFFKRNAVDFSLLVGGELKLDHYDDDTSASVNIGIAPQIDFHLGDFINLEVHLGFGVYNLSGGDSNFSILPTIGASLLHNLYF